MAIGYTEIDFVNGGAPALNATNLNHMDEAIKDACDLLDAETAAGRAIVEAANAAAQRSALGLGDSATKNVGTGAGDVAAGNAPAGAVTAHESTYAHANLPTAAGKTAADAIGAASGANVGTQVVNRITEAGFSLSPATGADNLDNIADGTSYKRVTAAEKTAMGATTASSPWTAPTLFFPDAARSELERISGGRATIRYSADGAKVPHEFVWVDAFNCADVSPHYSRARANNTEYLLGQWVTMNGQLYEVTTQGTSGGSAPTYGVDLGDEVTDGTVTFTLRVNAYTDLFPAFKIAGVAKGGKWISRFPIAMSGVNPLSIGGQIPVAKSINDMRLLAAKFTGAVPMSCWDYEALALDALRKGVTPVGNTNYGRSHKTNELVYGGIRGDLARPGDTSVSSNPYTRGGSAGIIWTHDRTMWGVHDFVGNMSQWCDGVKWMDGQLYIAAHDADPALFSTAGEATWIATGIFLNAPSAGDDSGASDLGAPNFDASVTNYTASVTPPRDVATIQADVRDLDYASGTWGSIVVSAGIDAIDAAMRLSAFRLGIMPKSRSGGQAPASAQEGALYIRNNGERFVYRGGFYFSTTDAGPRYCNANSRRASTIACRLVIN